MFSCYTEEADAEELKTRCRFNVGDAFMVLGYVDYDLEGLMSNPNVVSWSLAYIDTSTQLDLICVRS